MPRAFLFIAIGSALAIKPTIADACSAPPCWPGFITPRTGTRVPANVPGIYWKPMSGDAAGNDPANVLLATAADPNTPLAFTAIANADGSYLLVPTAPLTPDVTYVVTDRNTCEGFAGITGPTASFQVTESAPMPTALGTIAEVTNEMGPLNVATSSGSCTAEVTAHQITITPQLIFEALPWNDVFHFDVLVDGRVWERTSSINTTPSVRGTWTLYHTCESTDPGAADGLSEGPHVVEVRATLPGTQTVLAANQLTVELACSGDTGDGDGDRHGGCNAGGATASASLLLAIAPLLRRRRRR